MEEEKKDGEKLKEEHSACQPFLVDTEMENGRHKVFNFQMSKLDTKIINEKLEEVFNKLDSAAKINIALRFVLQNTETGEYRYFDAHERQNTKWRFKLIINVTIFAALLKNIPMGCQDSVLPKPLLKNPSVNCLLSHKDKKPYKDHLCLFRALEMYLNGHKDLISHTFRNFTEFILKYGCHRNNFVAFL